MKQFIIGIFILLLGAPGITAQEVDSTQFLFRNFENALIYYKDGRIFQVPINYNLLTGYFLFKDKNDNDQLKSFAEPKMVELIKIGERVFLPTEKGATEIIQVDPPFHVQYRGKIRNEEKLGAYGVRSATSAIATYSSIETDGVSHRLQTEKEILAGVYQLYRIVVNKKKKSFSTEKQFLKIYPKRKDILKQYIDENKIDFHSVDQVLQLFNYAESLK